MSVDQARRLAGRITSRSADADRERYDRATADLDPPLAVVDLGAFDRNAADMTRRAAGHPIRVATKSLRCRYLIERALATPGYRGVMCYSLATRGRSPALATRRPGTRSGPSWSG